MKESLCLDQLTETRTRCISLVKISPRFPSLSNQKKNLDYLTKQRKYHYPLANRKQDLLYMTDQRADLWVLPNQRVDFHIQATNQIQYTLLFTNHRIRIGVSNGTTLVLSFETLGMNTVTSWMTRMATTKA